jgi:hypothetical protein
LSLMARSFQMGGEDVTFVVGYQPLSLISPAFPCGMSGDRYRGMVSAA